MRDTPERIKRQKRVLVARLLELTIARNTKRNSKLSRTHFAPWPPSSGND